MENIKHSIGFGIAGFGMIGHTHLAAIQANRILYENGVSAYPRALCTRRPELFRDFPFDTIYTDFEQLAGDPKVKVVDICTPNNLHSGAVKSAIKTGKCVYVEKPLSNDLREAEGLARLAEEAGIPNQCALTLRFRPHSNRMKDLLEEKILGDVIHFRACFFHGSYLDPNRPISWRQQFAVSGGGAVMDLGIHILDMLRYFLGDVRRLRATSRTVNKTRYTDEQRNTSCVNETDEYFMVSVEMKDGSTGILETSRVSDSVLANEIFEVFGTKGSLTLDFAGSGTLRLNEAGGRGPVTLGGGNGLYEKALLPLLPPARQTLGAFVDSHAAAIKNMANWAAGKKPFIGTATFSEAVKAQALVHACLCSAQKDGEWVLLSDKA
jgi:predicted dehydrogenase